MSCHTAAWPAILTMLPGAISSAPHATHIKELPKTFAVRAANFRRHIEAHIRSAEAMITGAAEKKRVRAIERVIRRIHQRPAQ
jgi:hypothetical protein